MQHVFISIKLGSELHSEEVREDVESRRTQIYRELNMDWLTQNVGGKIKTFRGFWNGVALPSFDLNLLHKTQRRTQTEARVVLTEVHLETPS